MESRVRKWLEKNKDFIHKQKPSSNYFFAAIKEKLCNDLTSRLSSISCKVLWLKLLADEEFMKAVAANRPKEKL